MIYFTSDLHFGHDRQFIYKPRGFESIQEHDETLIYNWNRTILPDDTVYILGDLMLNNDEHGIKCLNRLMGKKRIIFGNHDTEKRQIAYYDLLNTEILGYADMVKLNGYTFYLSHYPTMTGNLEKESLKRCVCNLYGHTHQKTNFYNDMPFMYHVGVDSHDCFPVPIEKIIADMNAECEKCLNML